jgi:hypothetical protein
MSTSGFRFYRSLEERRNCPSPLDFYRRAGIEPGETLVSEQELDTHLRECEACRRTWEAAQRVVANREIPTLRQEIEAITAMLKEPDRESAARFLRDLAEIDDLPRTQVGEFPGGLVFGVPREELYVLLIDNLEGKTSWGKKGEFRFDEHPPQPVSLAGGNGGKSDTLSAPLIAVPTGARRVVAALRDGEQSCEVRLDLEEMGNPRYLAVLQHPGDMDGLWEQLTDLLVQVDDLVYPWSKPSLPHKMASGSRVTIFPLSLAAAPKAAAEEKIRPDASNDPRQFEQDGNWLNIRLPIDKHPSAICRVRSVDGSFKDSSLLKLSREGDVWLTKIMIPELVSGWAQRTEQIEMDVVTFEEDASAFKDEELRDFVETLDSDSAQRAAIEAVLGKTGNQ